MTMTPEQRDQWANALRGGEYLQGKGCLKHTGSDGVTRYCCLGVAQELFNLPASRSFVDYSFLPEETQTRLANMNDHGTYEDEGDGNYTFNEIADYIEKNL